MQTNFTPEQLSDPAVARSNQILIKCLQCGYCLDNCPTYQLTGDEYDSPRGRVSLIKDMLESNDKPERRTVNYIDRCLSCLACLSTCPSFVNYMHLVDHAREHIEKNYKRSLFDRVLRWSIAKVLPNPKSFRLTMQGAKLIKPIAFTMPRKIRNLLELVPDKLPPVSLNDKPQIFPAIGERKHRVILMTGCVQKTLNTNINDATIRILRRHCCEIVIVKDSGCCGALTYHMGKSKDSMSRAANSIRAWMKEVNGSGVDSIVINTSGCGTVIKEYGQMFINDDELSKDAAIISKLTKDISEILSDIKLEYQLKPNLRVAYHATCSLQFGQRIRYTPKKLLKQAGFTVIEPINAHTCCGSAGTYNLTQPDVSKVLKDNKVRSLEQITPDAIVAGNIGCIKQISSGTDLPVIHTIELLDWVTGGPVPSALINKVQKEK